MLYCIRKLYLSQFYYISSIMNIVVLDGYTLNPGDLSWEGLQKLGNLTVYDRTLKEEIIVRSLHADAVFTNKVVFDAMIINQLPSLKFIGVLATGYNVVDLAAARGKGIVVTNIPAYSTASVAQLVFSHILNFTHRVELHAGEVRNGKWTNCSDFCYTSTPQIELAGKTLGIIGFGRIGQAVARIGHVFGMNIIFQNRSERKGVSAWCRQTDLESVFRESDFISINCQLSTENQGFVNTSLLSLMKPSAFLVNAGRGALVNENDLADALNNGTIAGAGLDVLSTEPPKNDNPLLTARNCFITPHIAWATLEARSRLMQTAVGNLKAFIDGNPVNRVN
jgi:glycerate dehydrogenase